MTTRHPAVAGMFYPSDPGRLSRDVEAYLEEAAGEPPPELPKALIAPHAGYIYSGPVAGSAFAQLLAARRGIERVVVIGPSHFVPFSGLAVSPASTFSTPLGEIEVDRQAIEEILPLPQVSIFGPAHEREHALEVELPFLQEVLDDFSLVPLVVGEASGHEVGEVLARLWGGEETVLVISSDLSHYLDYGSARRRDEETSHRIVSLDEHELRGDQACGARAINGLIWEARRRGMQARLLDLRNSGDTAGPKDRVVGYGAYAFTEV